jgi:hypothetical protein
VLAVIVQVRGLGWVLSAPGHWAVASMGRERRWVLLRRARLPGATSAQGFTAVDVAGPWGCILDGMVATVRCCGAAVLRDACGCRCGEAASPLHVAHHALHIADV